VRAPRRNRDCTLLWTTQVVSEVGSEISARGVPAARARADGLGGKGQVAGHLLFAHLLVVAFVERSLAVFFFVGDRALLPQVVPAEQLPDAVARTSRTSCRPRAHAIDACGENVRLPARSRDGHVTGFSIAFQKGLARPPWGTRAGFGGARCRLR
jgi:hypothetical protein